jgi:ABC-type sugar transport system ATPase subunit
MSDPRPDMPPLLLQIDHLTKSYPKVAALDDISLALAAGEIHAVLGEEYAGKTTLLRILGGLEKPGTYHGEILLDGQPLALKNPRQAIDHGIAIVPRRLQLFDHLTLAENICVGHLPGKGLMIDNAAIERQARRALDLLELRLDPGARPPQLSPAQQRMVMIARAVSLRPRLVVMDEPATSLNSAEALGSLIRAVRVLSAHEIGVLYLTRRASEVLQVADRVSVLRDGAVAGTFERAAFDERTLKDLMASQQYRDFGHADDDEEPCGLDRWLRTVFSGWR